jgi:hypothetical protein
VGAFRLPVALDTTPRVVFSAQSTFGFYLTPRQVWKFGGGDGKEFSQTWFEGIKTFKTDKETSLKALAQYPRFRTETSWKTVPKSIAPCIAYGDSKAVNFALDQMIKDLPNGINFVRRISSIIVC